MEKIEQKAKQRKILIGATEFGSRSENIPVRDTRDQNFCTGTLGENRWTYTTIDRVPNKNEGGRDANFYGIESSQTYRDSITNSSTEQPFKIVSSNASKTGVGNTVLQNDSTVQMERLHSEVDLPMKPKTKFGWCLWLLVVVREFINSIFILRRFIFTNWLKYLEPLKKPDRRKRLCARLTITCFDCSVQHIDCSNRKVINLLSQTPLEETSTKMWCWILHIEQIVSIHWKTYKNRNKLEGRIPSNRETSTENGNLNKRISTEGSETR